ncbi:hypothetical protein F2Q69_00013268 [Brassica cretica]|uniref:Uncharacterized protein n=1 Tax=Brassica cretica TaxID=69181 RepID=A0A8S9R4P7_BRACR|nr:hypothetical protein F2Q69_00013268 [Brassica cretica]
MTCNSERLKIAERGKERHAGSFLTRISWKMTMRLWICRKFSLAFPLLVEKCFDLKLRILPAISNSELMSVVMEIDSHGCTAGKLESDDQTWFGLCVWMKMIFSSVLRFCIFGL